MINIIYILIIFNYNHIYIINIYIFLKNILFVIRKENYILNLRIVPKVLLKVFKPLILKD